MELSIVDGFGIIEEDYNAFLPHCCLLPAVAFIVIYLFAARNFQISFKINDNHPLLIGSNLPSWLGFYLCSECFIGSTSQTGESLRYSIISEFL